MCLTTQNDPSCMLTTAACAGVPLTYTTPTLTIDVVESGQSVGLIWSNEFRRMFWGPSKCSQSTLARWGLIRSKYDKHKKYGAK